MAGDTDHHLSSSTGLVAFANNNGAVIRIAFAHYGAAKTVSMHAFMCVCVYMYIYIYRYTCIYTYIHIYTHVFRPWKSLYVYIESHTHKPMNSRVCEVLHTPILAVVEPRCSSQRVQLECHYGIRALKTINGMVLGT